LSTTQIYTSVDMHTLKNVYDRAKLVWNNFLIIN
jgi:site-specific recombinase XerC